MKIAIIGLSSSGKSTVFNILTGANIETGFFSMGKSLPNKAVVKVPDERVEKLTEIFNPKKKTPAEIVFEDYVGIVKDGSKKKDSLFSEDVKQADALVNVCRAFEDEAVSHSDGSVNALRDAEIFELELIMADLALVETRIARIKKDLFRKKTPALEVEAELMERIKTYLEEEKPLRQMEMTEEDKKLTRGYCFLSQKPMLLLVNIGEDQLSDFSINEIEEFACNAGLGFQVLCGRLEMEISQVPPEEQQELLDEFGIEASARDIFIRKAYEMLGLISFFTVGEDEVRAWTIKKDTHAVDAAGEIHTDLSRGFIRAETISYDDFMSIGSLVKAKEKGMLRQEGKTYIVKDGDIINVKFNV